MVYLGTKEEKEYRRQYRIKNKDALIIYFKKYRKEHAQERAKYNKKYIEEHKQEHKEYYKIYNQKNAAKTKIVARNYYLAHKQEKLNYCKKYRVLKYSSDSIYRLKHDIKAKINIALKKAGENKNWKKWEDILGYDAKQLKIHLEKQFSPEMSWANIGKFWEIDHIVPLSWFKNKEQLLLRGWALRNIQPLEKQLNRQKNNFYAGNPKTRIPVINL